MQSIEDKLKQEASRINRLLEEVMESDSQAVTTLKQSMNYTLFAGGKRIRPILSVFAARAVGGDLQLARQVGAAVEFIHTYSLIHDDLPIMDDDDYRRGKPSNHLVYGPGIAALAGDGLLTYAFQYLTRLDLEPQRLLTIIGLIARGAGTGGMVSGQVLDLEAEENSREITLEQLKRIHELKTGALITGAVLAGAYCGDPDEDQLKSLEEYGYHLGLTFQITDDILDLVGDSERLGKETGQDQARDKATYTGILGLEGARQQVQKQAESARGTLAIFDNQADDLRRLVDFVAERDH